MKAKDALEKISFKCGRNVEKFTSYINSHGIPFKLTINLIQNIAVQRMIGSEQLIIVKNCDPEVLFPECENICKIAQLWKNFLDIHGDFEKLLLQKKLTYFPLEEKHGLKIS